MRGEFIAVWSASWDELWRALAASADAPDDLFCELYGPLTKALTAPPTPQETATVTNDRNLSRSAFQEITAIELRNEHALVDFLEEVHEILEELWGDALATRYYDLLSSFVAKYSLGYDLYPPCTLSPSLSGVFANLLRNLRQVASQNPHLDELLGEFEGALRDIRKGGTEGRIKTCVQKQINLLEALGRAHPSVTKATLGGICDELPTWPHLSVKDAMKNLYTFSCDYPGIRHGGTPAKEIRKIDRRDLVAMSVLLMGFTPYLTQMAPHDLYRDV